MMRGFSLIELLIVVALLGIIMVGVSQLLVTTLSGTSKATASQLVKENGQFALGTMERTVRRARRVTTCAGPTLIIDVPDTAGTVVTYTFQQSGSQLTRRVNTEDTVSLVSTPDVTVDSFLCTFTQATANNPSIVKLELNLSKSATGATDLRVLSQRFETTVSLRTYY